MSTSAPISDVDDRVARLVRLKKAARHAQMVPGARHHVDQPARGWWASLDD